ncbi:ComF family protein [Zobellia galactanivorans]|uniref:Phosphoribosyltransferase n=1 Tax=Zobellia galactanivorans (strain DSM 12802 / CCUG 47099 / CIP 106680 / NCIMB 13871 / Dsij) TaxID=63186 RepID=G0LAL7_ZOBGA|nr:MULTISPECIES: ComF family protein [Zobellia]MBU3028058.1 ComF family protein [Zobellia galactanivorans]MDO6515876.1 ComF family protein [Zobellia uliginosa]MDO6808337.1 ComF family protein [Zobellia galactanivorans]OWW27436.1 amidophosphoribosyltransferase [Zobellia sp. OII3]CAZ95478.1 Phosphoribosyltransferase [Zobellia galactanivorans]
MLTNILNDINSILAPRVCFGCNAHLYGGEQLLCTICRNDLPLTDYSFNDENPVDRIFYGRINIKKASSMLFFSNRGIVRELIHYLKYRNQEQIGTFLGDWYGQILKDNHELTDTIDMVIPVPLHRKKLKKRGYNQVASFAKRLAFHLKTAYVDHILVKSANTKTQTKKSRIGRWQSDKMLYTVTDIEFIKNKHILLVDDVITTGATMELCARALAKAPGTTLYVASMAVVHKLWN